MTSAIRQDLAEILKQAINGKVIPITLPADAVIISNSEVDAHLTCERKHWFSFILNKEPKNFGYSLGIGVLGHEILAEFYRGRKEGLTKKIAEREAMILLSKKMISHEFSPDVCALVHVLVSRYIAQETISDTCEILAVEEDFYMPITNKYWYGMRLDLLVKVLTGIHRGNIMLVDHKFTYDFWSRDELRLNPQMPKYVPAVRLAGIPVHEAYLNQLRWRFAPAKIPEKNDEDLFKLSPVELTQARIRSAVKQQMQESEKILEARMLSPEMQQETANPSKSRMICRACPFKDPCIMVDEEQDIRGILMTNYQDRTYGYTKADTHGQ